MAASPTPKRSPLTPSTLTPPSLNRQHSYNTTANRRAVYSAKATAVLATLRSRSLSPGRPPTRSESPKMSPPASPLDKPGAERRTSWEECMHQRDGYISFPDFDLLRAQEEQYAHRQ